MATFKAYYETGSILDGTLEFHITPLKSAGRGAQDIVQEIANSAGVEVSLMRNGIEILSRKPLQDMIEDERPLFEEYQYEEMS